MKMQIMPTAYSFVQQAWPIYKKNFWQFVILTAGNFGLLVALFIAVLFLMPSFLVYSASLGILALIIVVLLFIGFVMTSFQALVIGAGEGGKVKIKSALKIGYRLMLVAAAATILTTFIELVGAVLFVVPGLIALTFFTFVLIEVVKSKKSAPDAIVASVAVVKKAAWHVGQLTFLGMVISTLLGFVPLGLFLILFLFYPVWFLATYLQYKKVESLKTKQKPNTKLIFSIILLAVVWLVITGFLISNQDNGYVNIGPSDFENNLELQIEQYFDQTIKIN